MQHHIDSFDGDPNPSSVSASASSALASASSASVGVYESPNGRTIRWEVYPFKPSLEHDMQNADLIISHAGAGSIMEGLAQCRLRNSNRNGHGNGHENEHGHESISSAGTRTRSTCEWKKLVVVINDKLMDNHQMELAGALASRGYLMMLMNPSQLLGLGNTGNNTDADIDTDADIGNDTSSIMDEIEGFQPQLFEGGNPSSFGLLLDQFMGFEKKS